MSSTAALAGGMNMTATSSLAPSGGSVGGSGGMDELLPLVLQLTNPEQVSECPRSNAVSFLSFTGATSTSSKVQQWTSLELKMLTVPLIPYKTM